MTAVIRFADPRSTMADDPIPDRESPSDDAQNQRGLGQTIRIHLVLDLKAYQVVVIE